MPLLLIDSTDACLDKLYIMAFTSNMADAQADDDSGHGVELVKACICRTNQRLWHALVLAI